MPRYIVADGYATMDVLVVVTVEISVTGIVTSIVAVAVRVDVEEYVEVR